MDVILNFVEARVLGSLIEKELTTPDYYPLTLNALTNACNQKSNRDPVMGLDEKTVVRALDTLREKKFAWQVKTIGSRVPKYEQSIKNAAPFSPQEIGILCVLLLRGPQTLGELRSRTARLYNFSDLSEVEATLRELEDRKEGPFVVKLPRQIGRKERRYTHLFCGEVTVDDEEESPTEAARLEVQAENERITELEQEVTAIRAELDELKKQFAEFARQFE
ncbi:YceH family protein [Desulfococcaceae bacterium HSG8]|nr:YceH family protein [Desulfococcaceae bacterium HSG8]